MKITILDTRFVTNEWRLTAQLKQPLKTSDGDMIEDGFVFQHKDENNNYFEQPITDYSSTKIFGNKKASSRLTTVSFEEGNAIILAMLASSVYKAKMYATEFIWTLENAP